VNKRTRLMKPMCFLLIICMVAVILVLQPVSPQKAHANPAVIFGVINGILAITNLAAGQASAGKSAQEMKKIQDQLNKQEKMLEQIQKQLADLQRSVDTLAKNLEINTKEIQKYIQQVGAQDGIDTINTAYDQLEAFAAKDVTKMTGKEAEIERFKEDMKKWRDGVLGTTGGVKKAITKIKSAICPDIPGTQGVLELWTDLSILKMPAPRSAANDFSVKVESVSPSGGGDSGAGQLPVVAEMPQYFDYEGLDGGDLSPGETEPATEWYFAEGTCRPGFKPFMCINNPNDSAAEVEIDFMLGNGSIVKHNLEVPARFRSTVVVKDLLGEGDDAAHDFSTVVRSTNDVPVVAEMPQYFDYEGDIEGGFIISGVTSPGPKWYLAEGTCRPDFTTYVTIQNPGDTDTTARLTYMKGDGNMAEELKGVPAHSRVTVRPSTVLGVADDAAHDFSTRVESVDGAGLVVSRPMYFSYDDVWAGGHCSTAVPGTTPVNYLAEGTCRPDFATFITIQNPGDWGTTARLTYMRGDGTTAEELKLVPAHSRVTVRPSDLLGVADDAAHDFSTRVESTDGSVLVVERPEYFLYQGVWAGGHCAPAAPEPSVTEYFAEGTIRQGFDPYVTIQNPNDAPVDVLLTYMWGDGWVTSEERTIPANARDTVRVEQSPAARTLTSYYESLKGYLETLLYYQQKGMACIADAYNGRLTEGEEPPAPEILDYIKGTFRKQVKAELDEFLTCVESLAVSWSYKYAPNGLMPGASDILADADSLYMNYYNSLLSAGTGSEKNYYGAFARAFSRQPDTVPGVMMTGAGLDGPVGEQAWYPVKLKYYDAGQQKLITDAQSVVVARSHQNCEPGTYRAGIREGNITTGGASPSLAKTSSFEVITQQGPGGEDDPPNLPFGSTTFVRQPSAGYLSQFGGIGTPEMMTGTPGPAIAVSAGNDYCIYLQPGSTPFCGRIKGWGDNSRGQLGFPDGDEYVQLSAGFWHGLALKSDGSIVGWGYNSHNQAKGCPKGTDYVQVAAGWGHSLALKKDGSIVGWGYNGAGEINCPAGNDYAQVAAGWEHSLALKSDGSIVGWGSDSFGQTSCPPGNDYVQVVTGKWHSLALKKDGSIVGWGNNRFGEIDCPPGNDYVQVAAGPGSRHSLALKRDGSIVGWGLNDYGQASAPSGAGSVAIAAGGHTSLYISGCALVGWGDNHCGKTNCPAGRDYVQVAAGGHHSISLRSNGSIVGWGDNRDGQINCPAGNDFFQVSAGGSHSLALKRDGSIVGWGDNADGERNCPGGNDFVQVAAGQRHSIALKRDGSIVGWGWNKYGQTNCPGGNDFVQVSAGCTYSLALKRDGSIVGWGNNDKGQRNCPGGNDFVQVSAGWSHGLALKRDGSIVGWGDNSSGQRNCPAGNDYMQVAGGGLHSLALKRDGSIVGWGMNFRGESRPPGGNDYTQVSGGWYYSLGLKKIGLQPWSWR